MYEIKMLNKAILISGCPGTGKTTTAIKLANFLGIDQLVSTDIIRSVLRSSNKEENPFLYSVTHEAWKYLGEKNSDNIWNGFLEHCRPLYPSMNYLIQKSFSEGRDLILEGAHITPEFIRAVSPKYRTYSFLLTVKEDTSLLKRFDYKNNSRTILYDGWKQNFDIIRAIESRVLMDCCFDRVLENSNIDNTLNEIVNSL
jgi:2-phosphoglycerate kinase